MPAKSKAAAQRRYPIIRKAITILLYIFASLLGIGAVSYLLFRTKPVQTWATQKVTAYLANALHTDIHISGVDIDFFTTLVLEDFYMADLKKDTLMYVHELGVNVNKLEPGKNLFDLKEVSISDAKFYLKTYKGDTHTNLQFLIDYFSSTDTAAGKPVKLTAQELNITNASFIYENENRTYQTAGINFEDIHVSGIAGRLKNISIISDTIKCFIAHLNLKEKSGFTLNHFEARAKVTSTEIEAAQFVAETPQSRISRYYSMRYTNWKDFADYNNKVRMFARLDNSEVSSKDIAYFAPTLQTVGLRAKVSGQVSGTVSNLESNKLTVFTGSRSLIATSFSIKGLPEIDQTVFDVTFMRVLSNHDDVEETVQYSDETNRNFSLPALFTSLGGMNFEGNFRGYYNRFVAKGTLRTDIGNVKAHVNMEFPQKGTPSYKGSIETERLNAGALTDARQLLGNINLAATVQGEGFTFKDLNSSVSATIRSAEFNRYTYRNVQIKGDLKKKLFAGEADINDPNIVFAFDGSIDFNDPDNPAFHFVSSVQNAQLHVLNLAKDSMALNTSANINFFGNAIDNIQGNVSFGATALTYKQTVYTIGGAQLNAKNNSRGKSLELRSDLADISVSGAYDLKTIASAFKATLRQYIVSYDWGEIATATPQDFRFNIKLKNTEPLTTIFLPELRIPHEAAFTGTFNNIRNEFIFSGGVNELYYHKAWIQNLIIDGSNDQGFLALNVSADNVMLPDSIFFRNVTASNNIAEDSLHFNLKLDDQNSVNRLDLNGEIAFGSTVAQFNVLPSELILDNQPWKIKEAFTVIYSENRYVVSSFALTNGSQKIKVNGFISDEPEDELRVQLSEVNLSTVNQLTKNYDIRLSGIANGNARLSTLLKNPKIASTITVTDLMYNADSIGDVHFTSTYDNISKLVTFNGSVTNKTTNAIEIKGQVNTAREKDNLYATIMVNEAQLSILEPFINDFVSNVRGTATAIITATGSLDEPELNGRIGFENAGLTVNYLKTSVNFSDVVIVDKDRVKLTNFLVSDVNGKHAVANGQIILTDFKNPILNIQLQTSEFLCLNTTAKDNELYYGKALASGNFSFNGPVDEMVIDVLATTDRGTQFFIPISEESSSSGKPFINFVNKNDTIKQQLKKKINLSGLQLNFDLNVTNQAEVRIVLDPLAGDGIISRGNGNIRLAINTLGDFQMFGQYTIERGKYLFTFQNVSKKEFDVEKGGTIRWDGDPANAQININAIYELRPQVRGLYEAARLETTDSTKRILVQCILGLQKNLLNPDISFALNFPEDESIKNTLGPYLSNQDNVNQQFFYLLLVGKFYTPSNNNAAASGLSSSVNELISAQLSDLSKLVYKGLDINLLSGVGGSLTLFDERVTISGTLVSAGTNTVATNTTNQTNGNGAEETPNTRASQVTGDVTVEYRIGKTGNTRLTAFNRTANEGALPERTSTTQTIQGMGIFHRQEFDTWGELWEKIFKRKKPR